MLISGFTSTSTFLVPLELLSMTCSSACPGSPSIESDSAMFEAPPLLQSASSSELSPSTRNEALRSGEGVPGAECTATRTIGSCKSQAGREIILGSVSFGLGSHLQHTTAAVLRQSPPGRTLGLSRLRVRPGMYGTDRRLDWEEFLQERATTTLKRSITLLHLRVLRPHRGLGKDQAAAVDPSETDFLPAQQCCPHAAHARS